MTKEHQISFLSYVQQLVYIKQIAQQNLKN